MPASLPSTPQHYGVRKAAAYEAPLPSKEPLLLVNGLRSFMARPVYSTDEHGADKHKMERYLHEGRWAGWKERKKERRKGKREEGSGKRAKRDKGRVMRKEERASSRKLVPFFWDQNPP